MLNSGLVLYHIKASAKEHAIRKLCRQLGLQIRELKASDTNVEVGVLAGISRTSGRTHEKPPVLYEIPDMLIFSGVSEAALDRFLEEYKKAGIEPTGLKAVVTPHNFSWTVYELAAELVRERMSMTQRGEGK